ncbi:phosphotriesterase [Petroclostridium sp. X23]|uniref:phosphotriesterase family protein n=1 Tax=Petroclostridium sp. X23 TaxID=3045146 RepID=UPI0024AD599D|nr:phosphotriesterase [Petroclostridium sp. X23]WHH58512.1 phosphotriesterase [Petroclostridium sp. X23]
MKILNERVQTVLGLIDSSQLGYCHCHEHLFIENGQSAKINPVLRIDDLNKSTQELVMFKQFGGTSIVDAQPIGCGRMAYELVEASRLSGVHIIASTGFHKLIFYPESHWINGLRPSSLAELFVSELREGMFVYCDQEYPERRIEAKAGIVKVALDQEGLTKRYQNLLTVAAYAAIETGVSILCHTEVGEHSLMLAEFLIEQGVKENAIILCHMDRTAKDLSYHRAAAEMGVYLEYDTIGRFKYHTDEDEALLIARMIEGGHEDRILLGLDTTRSRLKSYGGDIGLSYISQTFIPLLKNYGITDEFAKKCMVINPAKALAIKR